MFKVKLNFLSVCHCNMFSQVFYDNLDPTYRQLINKLEEDLRTADSSKTKELLDDFSGKYMMPKELWDKRLQLEQDIEEKESLIKPSLFHFYYNEENWFGTNARWNQNVEMLPRRKLYFVDYDDEYYEYYKVVEDFLFPHKQLEIKMNDYQKEVAVNFIPKSQIRIFEKMEKLYDKIISVEENDEEWFATLTEADDVEFVAHNVEYRLGADLTNKKLWKLYIQYLKDRDAEALLQVYSKYCRFFLDDSEMKEEYREAAKHKGPVTVSWKNPFDFEIFNDKNEKFVNLRKLRICDNYKTAKPQHFAFKNSVIHYIVQNGDAYLLNNLFKSCKWFYVKYPIKMWYNLDIEGHHSKYIGNKRNEIYPNEEQLQQICTSAYIVMNFYFSNEDPTKLSSLIPLMHKCTAEYINLGDQKLTLKELEFLVVDAKELFLYGEYFKDGKTCMLEDILKLTPKLHSFLYHAPDNVLQCSPKTSQELLDLPNKFILLSVGDISKGFLEPLAFAEFVKKNISSKLSSLSTIYIWFDFDDTEEYIKNINDTVTSAINDHYSAKNRPHVLIKNRKNDQ